MLVAVGDNLEPGYRGKMIGNFLQVWQKESGVMTCQTCNKSNMTKGMHDAVFLSFKCDHFNFVCIDCSQNASCDFVLPDNSVCGAPQLSMKHYSTKFPHRPWLDNDAQIFNEHRREVLEWRTAPEPGRDYEDYASERAKFAHGLANDHTRTSTIEQYRSTDVSATQRKAQFKAFTKGLADAAAKAAALRENLEVTVQDEVERQTLWLKRQRTSLADTTLDYEIFSDADHTVKLPRHRADASSPRRVLSRRRARGGAMRQREDIPPKPKRAYKFSVADGQPTEEPRLTEAASRACGFRTRWVHEKLMSDLAGAWS